MKRILSFIAALVITAAVCCSCGDTDAGTDGAGRSEAEKNEETIVRETEESEETIIPETEPVVKRQACKKTIKNSERPEVKAVQLSGMCEESIKGKVGISDLYNVSVLHSGVVGLVGVPIELIYDDSLSDTNICFIYDSDELRGIPQKNLIMLHYNEEDQFYDTVENAVLNEDEHTVSADISEGGVYLLADAYQWYDCWGIDVSEYEYDRRPEDYPTDWERECDTGSIMELADKEWAMENAPEFHVSDAEELASVVWYVNGIGADDGVFVCLENDIDLTGYDWKPMGWTNGGTKYQFSGCVDGQGHTVNGMTISSGYEDTGFIGYGLCVMLRDISFTNADVSATGCTGIAGGQLYMCYEWINVHTQGKVSGGSDDYGAIVGRETDITFRDCTADVTVDGEPFEYLSYRQKREADVEIVETFNLTMSEDHTVTRDEHEGFWNLGWTVKYNGVEVLDRNAEGELSYRYFGNDPGTYTIYLTAYINGTYIRVSNIIEYTI